MRKVSVFKNEPVQKIHPTLIDRMEVIVKQVVVQEKFRADFYMDDLKCMESSSVFAWYVYDCGSATC